MATKFLSPSERKVLEAVAALADLNPFLLATHRDLEHKILGDMFVAEGAVWHRTQDVADLRPNVPRLIERAGEMASELRERLASGAEASAQELGFYEAVVRYLLFSRYEQTFQKLIEKAERGEATTGTVSSYRSYLEDHARFFEIPRVRLPSPVPPARLFAWGFQIRRAFYHTFRQIYGASRPATELRATVWQSIFTHNTERYARVLFERMGDITTLIQGPSGTGKELVARAIGLSRFIAFDEKSQCFTEDYARGFLPVNLSALSATIIESELFGHRKGAFTGAAAEHSGWLEVCGKAGTVFLDEIGELDPSIQVKLLRVLQERRFQRVGETIDRPFQGKLIAATNRDLPDEVEAGRFRQDLYYRLCADVIHAPSLREQLADCPEDLETLVAVLAERIVGRDEAPALTAEVVGFVDETLGRDYPWPGNVRELEQCVRNVLIRGEYQPRPPGGEGGGLAGAFGEQTLTAEELLSQYCTHVYARTGSYEESARRLGLDRRTVKAKIDAELLERLTGEG